MPTSPPTRCLRCHKLRPSKQRCPCTAWTGSKWKKNLGISERTWRKTRRAYLNAHPLCNAKGCKAIADQVDHIVELSEGGDPLDWDNLQSLCVSCHAEKTSAHAHRRRRGTGSTSPHSAPAAPVGHAAAIAQSR